MKKLLFLYAITLLLSACSGNVNDKTAKKNTENSISFANDMENASAIIPSWLNESTVGEGIAHSGKFSCMMDETREYSYSFQENFGKISSKLPKKILINAWIYSTVENPDISFVVDIYNKEKSILWNSAVVKSGIPKANIWTEVNYAFDISKPIDINDNVRIFIWNQHKLKFYYDDATVTFEY